MDGQTYQPHARNKQGFIQGFFDPPPHSESLGGGGISVNTKVKSKLNHETSHQGIINSWLCYSLLGEALVIPRSLPLVNISKT